MTRRGRSSLLLTGRLAILAASFWMSAAQSVSGETLLLKDGRQLQGKVAPISGMADYPLSPKGDAAKSITLVDDGLRRVFVPRFRIQQQLPANGPVKEKIGIEQHVATAGARMGRMGPIVKVTPFDNFGRRTFSMMTDKGRLDVVQGITTITPAWTKVESLFTKKQPVIWDMRVATSSIPLADLKGLLTWRINPKNLQHRLQVVRLYLQMELFQEAKKELAGVVKDFPNEPDLAKEVQSLSQLHARRIVDEIKMRRKAGQHQLAYRMLETFPNKEVAGDILQQVSELLEEYREIVKKIDQLHKELAAQVANIKDTSTRQQCEAMLKEMSQELSISTLDRMAAYIQLSSDASLADEQKVALAISGWLLGGNNAETNIAVALSLAKVRGVVVRYLNETVKLEREQLFKQLGGMEGAAPIGVTRLIANMKPPLVTPSPSPGQPGFYKLSIPPGVDQEPDVNYDVQLPPQYDPLVRYPTILTLNGLGTTPEKQIDWWAGAMDANGNRLGQATRHGYIVIAVDWLKSGQKEYEFSAREHAAILGSLRDACRRFSIDTDRVFLSGHSLGGNAAWDIGLAHPDLWAGVIPIVGLAEKYCSLYWKNASLVPFYVLAGEMDGDKTIKNAATLDRYMHKGFDVTVSEYIGRGHEDFYEDILNIFDWMSHREPRNFFPKQFTVSTMRTWDNYFWWLEASKLPPGGIVEPSDWPPARGTSAIEITGKVNANNGLSIQAGGIKVAVWLSPELVDFNKRIDIKLNGSKLNPKNPLIQPELNVLLEDVRTRGDRLHPFWAKVEQP